MLIFQLSYSGDPLTINVERDRHCAVAIFILGHTGVLSWYTSLSNHQGTHSLIGINRVIITDYSKQSKTGWDKQQMLNITSQNSTVTFSVIYLLGFQSPSEQQVAVNRRVRGLDQVWSVLYSPERHINERIHLEFKTHWVSIRPVL